MVYKKEILTMTSFTVSKNDVISSIISELNLDTESFWTHEQMLGHLEMYGLSYDTLCLDDVYVYHFGNAKGSAREIFNDMIVAVDYSARTIRPLTVSRPLLGYVKPSDNDILVKWPVRDGTVFRYIYILGAWRMVSKNSLDISDKCFFEKSFSDIFEGLIGGTDVVWDTNKSYVVSMTSSQNCLYKDTVDSYVVLEEVSEDQRCNS